jgi:ABC-2 type transport system permease protein
MSTGLAITKQVIKERRFVAIALGYMSGVVVFASIYGYRSAYPTLAGRMRLAMTFSHDAGIAAVFGPARVLETVSGFVAFRTLGVIPLIVGIWATLTATKALRGNEESGRWEILVSSPITRGNATLATIRGLYGSITITLLISSILIAVAARISHDFPIRSSLFFSLSLIAAGYFFASVGALASQLTALRKSASAIAGTVIGLSFLVRAIADSSTTFNWVHWLSPLGWVTESAPLTHPQWWGLLLLLIGTLICTAAAVSISGKRDLHSSLFVERKSRTVNFRVTSVSRLWVALHCGNILSWIIGLFFMAFAFGLVAHGASKAFSGSSTIQNTFAKLGIVRSNNFFFGIIFLLLAAGLMFASNSFAAALREQESNGYLDHILVSPLPRTLLMVSRLLVSTVSLVLMGISAGIGAFIGSSISKGELSFHDAIFAGLNLVPSALVMFGISIAIFGIHPRASILAGQSLLAWSFLLELIGSTIKLNHWILDTSLLHHMAFAPAVPPNWPKNTLLLIVSFILLGIGSFAFNNRDTAIGD